MSPPLTALPGQWEPSRLWGEAIDSETINDEKIIGIIWGREKKIIVIDTNAGIRYIRGIETFQNPDVVKVSIAPSTNKLRKTW